MNFGICDLSVIPLRAEASDKSELVSQLLFGEVFEVQEQNKQWLRIHTFNDDYDGWIDSKQVKSITHKSFKDLTSSISSCSLLPITSAQSRHRKILLLMGSSLPYLEKNIFRINEEAFTIDNLHESQNGVDQIPFFALQFLDSPYLWGGRSIFGIDCSGFTNIVFKITGIQLRRDAWQQSEQGILVNFIDEARPGDLAFFQNEEGKITHTGILLGNGKIIHASGRVRIDTIDHYGIYNEEQQRYSHQLRLIRRMIG